MECNAKALINWVSPQYKVYPRCGGCITPKARVLATESQGRTDVLVTGYFPGKETTQACVDGRLMGLTDSDCEFMAYTAVTKVIDILLGKEVEPFIQTDVHYIYADGAKAWQEAHS